MTLRAPCLLAQSGRVPPDARLQYAAKYAILNISKALVLFSG